jgi:hypothetical protein
MARGGYEKVYSVMKGLQLDQMILFPRIKRSICKTLDYLPKLKIIEYEIEFSKEVLKI